MEFVEPTSAAEAAAILASDGEAKCLAGGATLVAMMNAHLIEPSLLVSLRRIPSLSEISLLNDGSVRIGAMVRHRAVAESTLFTGGQTVVSRAAAKIGHPAIRNMGTIGGSICHADPSADYPTAITAASAMVEIQGENGIRTVPAADFFQDWFETAVRPGELVTAVIVPPGAAGAGAHYEKFVRADGDFATVSVAAVVAMDGDVLTSLSVAVGGAASTPIYDSALCESVKGMRLSDDTLGTIGNGLASLCDPIDDMRGSAAFRLKLVPRLVARAIRLAAENAGQG